MMTEVLTVSCNDDGGNDEFFTLNIELMNGCSISLTVTKDPETTDIDPRPGINLWRDDNGDADQDCLNDMIGGDHVSGDIYKQLYPDDTDDRRFTKHLSFSSAHHKEGVRQFIEFCEIATGKRKPTQSAA